MPAKKRPLSGRAKDLHEAKVARLAAQREQHDASSPEKPATQVRSWKTNVDCYISEPWKLKCYRN